MKREFNVATGVFPGFNDREGLMICGYEWGGGGEEVAEPRDDLLAKSEPGVTFSNKAPYYGEVANSWPYDRKIRSWFGFWGHELRRDGTGGDFEKCLVQTNWCNTQAHNMKGVNYWEKLLAPDQVKNFIAHIEHFRPRLILFFGSEMTKILNNKKALEPFVSIMGPVTKDLHFPSKAFSGKRFKVGFQSFERCKVVSLPHPSGSHGLNDDYIKLFSSEIGELIQEFKSFKHIACDSASRHVATGHVPHGVANEVVNAVEPAETSSS
ncbi:MAG: hypothetical protein WA135_14845 [Thiobacillus sp.]